MYFISCSIIVEAVTVITDSIIVVIVVGGMSSRNLSSVPAVINSILVAGIDFISSSNSNH